jgi:glycosyltransferase involved in cell wall biosynthesis
MAPVPFALAHDYLTQRGGAERVVASWVQHWPDAPLYTTLYAAHDTFPEFTQVADLRPSLLNLLPPLRHHHRWALPMLAPVVARTTIDADVTLASSSGWAHGYRTRGALAVYCHAPARWLYQSDRYLARDDLGRGASVAGTLLRAPLTRWDQRAAARADLYIANSTFTRDFLRQVYDRDAVVIPPPVQPPAILPSPEDRFDVLVVARLLPYKNVDLVLEVARQLADLQFVVVGDGPLRDALASVAPSNVSFTGVLSEAALWQHYVNAHVHLALSFEDFGITPLEAAAAGRPTVARRAGGYLDTITADTGELVPEGDDFVARVASAVREARSRSWSTAALQEHAATFQTSTHLSALHDALAGLRRG